MARIDWDMRPNSIVDPKVVHLASDQDWQQVTTKDQFGWRHPYTKVPTPDQLRNPTHFGMCVDGIVKRRFDSSADVFAPYDMMFDVQLHDAIATHHEVKTRGEFAKTFTLSQREVDFFGEVCADGADVLLWLYVRYDGADVERVNRAFKFEFFIRWSTVIDHHLLMASQASSMNAVPTVYIEANTARCYECDDPSVTAVLKRIEKIND